MALNLYREHTGECSQKRRVRLHSRKAEEAPRYHWKKCDCPIYASGTLKDGFRRRKTDFTTWPEAEAQAADWETAGTWSANCSAMASISLTAQTLAPESETATTIVDALKEFEKKAEDRKIKAPTLRKYKTFSKQFREFFCDQKGYVVTGQLQAADSELFYSTWKDGPKAAGRKLERFRKLVRLWMKRKYIAHDMGVFDIDPPMGANEAADRFPFTDLELEKIYDACDQIGVVHWENNSGSHSWSGQDVKEFIMLDIHTGLRISDVATFDVKERMIGNDIFLRAVKNGRRMYTWVPDSLKDILLDRQGRFGDKIFQIGRSQKLETVTDLWRRKLEKVFEVAQKEGPFETGSSEEIVGDFGFGQLAK